MSFVPLALLIAVAVGCSDMGTFRTSSFAKVEPTSHDIASADQTEATVVVETPEKEAIENKPAESSMPDTVTPPEPVAGVYLITCIADLPKEQAFCRLEDKATHAKVDLPDLKWQALDEAGVPLKPSVVSVVALNQQDEWHVRVTMSPGVKFHLRASSPQISDEGTMITPKAMSYAAPKLVYSEDFSVAPAVSGRWDVFEEAPRLDFSSQTMKCSTPARSTQYSSIFAKDMFSFVNGTAQARVVKVSASEMEVEQAFWGIAVDDLHRAVFYVAGGLLFARIDDDVMKEGRAVKKFDPITDKYLRIQHSEATQNIVFLSSLDGAAWNELTAFHAPRWLKEPVALQASCGAWAPASPSSSELDDLQLFLP